MNSSKIYDSDDLKNPLVEEILQIFQYRNLLFQLIRRDIVSRYKRSVLGIIWTLLNPLGMMLILSFVFSQVFTSTRAYPVYILAGLISWNFFAQTTTIAMNSLIWGGALLKRIYIPRSIFCLSAIGTGVVNIGLSIIPLLIVIFISGVKLTTAFLFLPIAIIILTFFSLGVGLMLSALAIYFPDVTEMYQIVVTAWMYLTPIIYPEEILDNNFQFVLKLNPMYYIVKVFRYPIYDGKLPLSSDLWIATIISLMTLVLGWWFFAKQAEEFSYRV